MKVEVIDDTDKSVKQQASGRCKNPLLKRGQVGIDVHVGTGTVDYRGSNIYNGTESAWQFRKTESKYTRPYPAVEIIVKARWSEDLMPGGSDIGGNAGK
jgi:hypothetical protein